MVGSLTVANPCIYSPKCTVQAVVYNDGNQFFGLAGVGKFVVDLRKDTSYNLVTLVQVVEQPLVKFTCTTTPDVITQPTKDIYMVIDCMKSKKIHIFCDKFGSGGESRMCTLFLKKPM